MDKPSVPSAINSIYSLLLFRIICLVLLIYSLKQEHYLASIFMLLFILLIELSSLISKRGIKNTRTTRGVSINRVFPNQGANLRLNIKNLGFFPAKIRWFQPLPQFIDAPAGNKGNILIKGKREKLIEINLIPQRRGLYLLPSLYLQSMDPFGLFLRESITKDNFKLIVYPELLQIEELPSVMSGLHGIIKDSKGFLLDPVMVSGLRDYTPDTPAKQIAWKASARRNKLLTKMLDPTTEQLVLIIIDGEEFSHAVMKDGICLEFEQALSIVATIASILDEKKIPFGFISNLHLKGADTSAVIPVSRGDGQILSVLEALAGAENESRGSLEDLLNANSKDIPWGTTLLTVGSTAVKFLPRQISRTFSIPINNRQADNDENEW